jgi:hypothetical protein
MFLTLPWEFCCELCRLRELFQLGAYDKGLNIWERFDHMELKLIGYFDLKSDGKTRKQPTMTVALSSKVLIFKLERLSLHACFSSFTYTSMISGVKFQVTSGLAFCLNLHTRPRMLDTQALIYGEFLQSCLTILKLTGYRLRIPATQRSFAWSSC